MRRNIRGRKKRFNYKIPTYLFLGILFFAIIATTNIKFAIEKMIISEILPFYVASANDGIYFDKSIVEKENEPVFVDLIGSEDVVYQPETDVSLVKGSKMDTISAEEMDKLHDLDYLKNKFYIVDKRTQLTAEDFNVEEFLAKDLTFENKSDGPKVLIFHTHISEMFADSDRSKGISEGIYGVGERLKENLEYKYGIEVYHDATAYDMVDGKQSTLGAYERMEPNIKKILQQYPTIELVIDLHRDGVGDDVKLVTNINGTDYAQIMFFNGLCKLNQNGKLEPVSNLQNPYIKDNLALSFNLQLASNQLYPELARKIYLNAYRYSLHMMPKSTLVEVGAQTNTKQEAFNSMEALADIIASVVLEQ